MSKTTEELFKDWVWAMSRRWVRLNLNQRVVQQDFGPVNIRMDGTGIFINPWRRQSLRFFEDARQFIKKTLEEARHEAAKENVALFEGELRRDLAESEFLSEQESGS